MNKNAIIKIIRVSVFAILLLMIAGNIIVEYIDNVKSWSVFFILFCFVEVIIMAIILRSSKFVSKRFTILDFLSIAMFIGLLASFGRGISQINAIQNSFNGNNGFLSAYSKGIGAKGDESIESALENELEYRNEELNETALEEIYRTQAGNRIFIYIKQKDESIVELDFFTQDNLYYSYGNKHLIYYGTFSSVGHTTEETIRKDIANTMWRGVNTDEVGGPAWGVSNDEEIYSMTVNSAKVDDVIEIDEKDGKKYYFWIITDIEGIETIDDVKEAKIEMNGSAISEQRDINAMRTNKVGGLIATWKYVERDISLEYFYQLDNTATYMEIEGEIGEPNGNRGSGLILPYYQIDSNSYIVIAFSLNEYGEYDKVGMILLCSKDEVLDEIYPG